MEFDRFVLRATDELGIDSSTGELVPQDVSSDKSFSSALTEKKGKSLFHPYIFASTSPSVSLWYSENKIRQGTSSVRDKVVIIDTENLPEDRIISHRNKKELEVEIINDEIKEKKENIKISKKKISDLEKEIKDGLYDPKYIPEIRNEIKSLEENIEKANSEIVQLRLKKRKVSTKYQFYYNDGKETEYLSMQAANNMSSSKIVAFEKITIPKEYYVEIPPHILDMLVVVENTGASKEVMQAILSNAYISQKEDKFLSDEEIERKKQYNKVFEDFYKKRLSEYERKVFDAIYKYKIPIEEIAKQLEGYEDPDIIIETIRNNIIQKYAMANCYYAQIIDERLFEDDQIEVVKDFINSDNILKISSIPIIANRGGAIFDKYVPSKDYEKIDLIFRENIDSKIILGKSDRTKFIKENKEDVNIEVDYMYADKETNDIKKSDKIPIKTKNVKSSVKKIDIINAVQKTIRRENIEVDDFVC